MIRISVDLGPGVPRGDVMFFIAILPRFITKPG